MTLLVCLLAAGACVSTDARAAGPSAPTGAAPRDTQVTLAIGAMAQLDDGTVVTLRDVTDDSRCPADATCIWAGDATVTIAVQPPRGATAVVVLHTGRDPQSAPAGALQLTLVRLDPMPTAARPVARSEYRAVLALSQ